MNETLPPVSGQEVSTGAPNDRQMNHRKRLRVSCGECRKKKISCDRRLPCHRCVRSGRPEQCSFEAGTRPPTADSFSAQYQVQHNNDQIRQLQVEVSQLRVLLSEVAEGRDSVVRALQDTSETAKFDQATVSFQEQVTLQSHDLPAWGSNNELLRRSPRGYYRQHTLFQFFVEIPGLFPFIRETADDWLKPRGVSLSKTKPVWYEWRTDGSSPGETSLEDSLPPKGDTDILVSFYLDHFEHLHRVLHVPTFKREYSHFWEPQRERFPAMTALVLAMISISACASSSSSDSSYIDSQNQKMPPKWISLCDDWLRQQGSKTRKFVYYQIGCLVYIAKRINSIRKKRFWNETGSLIQSAILDGLHCELASDSPYSREMKRRVWAVLRELDLQNAFEFELPTLLHTLEPTVGAPSNIKDEDFDEASKDLPKSNIPSQYTCTSFQYLNSRSWALRLEISRRMFGTGFSKAFSYDDVLRYTQELTQAIDSLPSWHEKENCGESSGMSILVSTLLQFQLKECILLIHRPYLRRGESRFSLSETICYCISRDILLLNSNLAKLGIQSLALLREDLLVASMSLTRIGLLQSRGGSTNFAIASSESTIEILEQCLPLIEDRYLRCFFGEPWGPLTMYGCIMLLKIHSGKETRQTAKSICAQRFLGLYYKHFARQQVVFPSQPSSLPRNSVGQTVVGSAGRQLPTSDTAVFSGSPWLDSGYSDLSLDSHDLDMDWDGMWESLWPTLDSQPVHYE